MADVSGPLTLLLGSKRIMLCLLLLPACQKESGLDACSVVLVETPAVVLVEATVRCHDTGSGQQSEHSHEQGDDVNDLREKTAGSEVSER